jgi:2'-5' RNA ligase
VTFYGEAVTLYESKLRRGGARYEPLARTALREWSTDLPGGAPPD